MSDRKNYYNYRFNIKLNVALIFHKIIKFTAICVVVVVQRFADDVL